MEASGERLHRLLFHEPVPHPETMTGGMLSGYTMETIVGADHTSAAGPHPGQMSFENLFRKVNRWGMPADSRQARCWRGAARPPWSMTCWPS